MTTELVPFEYAVLRVVPRVERGESINAGVLVYSQAAQFLGGRVHLDVPRLQALDPAADVAAIEAGLRAATGACEGNGIPGHEEIGRRFRWLTAPRSTVVQPGPVHTGLSPDVRAEPDRLLALLVLPLE
jgi:hypothetical protein